MDEALVKGIDSTKEICWVSIDSTDGGKYMYPDTDTGYIHVSMLAYKIPDVGRGGCPAVDTFENNIVSRRSWAMSNVKQLYRYFCDTQQEQLERYAAKEVADKIVDEIDSYLAGLEKLYDVKLVAAQCSPSISWFCEFYQIYGRDADKKHYKIKHASTCPSVFYLHALSCVKGFDRSVFDREVMKTTTNDAKPLLNQKEVEKVEMEGERKILHKRIFDADEQARSHYEACKWIQNNMIVVKTPPSAPVVEKSL